MRIALVLMTSIALSACEQQRTAGSGQGCARSAAHELTWSDALASDVITARADGPSCRQAVVTWVARNAAGDPLWAFASTYYDMRFGGAAPEATPAVSEAEVDEFLAGWANVTEMRSGALPAWRAGASSLTESATTFAYDTPFDRETYEMLRARDLPMICFASAVEATQCLIIDPASNAPTVLAAYGP
jgi:hypothetical protein